MHGLDHARKLDEHAVTRRLDDPPLAYGDAGVGHLLPQLLEGRDRPGLVDAHEPTVADDVRCKNRGKSAFHLALPAAGHYSAPVAIDNYQSL